MESCACNTFVERLITLAATDIHFIVQGHEMQHFIPHLYLGSLLAKITIKMLNSTK